VEPESTLEIFRGGTPDGLEANLGEDQGTLQGKSQLCIPFLGIARPQSQFPHSCVYECSAQTRTGIGILEKLPAVKQFLAV
jgi:hypothetical protein